MPCAMAPAASGSAFRRRGSANGVEIRVCDHGPGIPEAERERIFEPFYRGEQTRAQRVQGTGLGLSLVKNYGRAAEGRRRGA